MTDPVDSPRQQLREAIGLYLEEYAVDECTDDVLEVLDEAGWGPTAAHGELDHARAVIARHECATAGHDLGVETDDHGTPLRVLCSRPCGQGPWVVDHSGSHGR